MTVRTFVIVNSSDDANPTSPEEFQQFIYKTLLSGSTTLMLAARAIDDELAIRRNPAPVEFTFAYSGSSIEDGRLMVQAHEMSTQQYTVIAISGEQVIFALVED